MAMTTAERSARRLSKLKGFENHVLSGAPSPQAVKIIEGLKQEVAQMVMSPKDLAKLVKALHPAVIPTPSDRAEAWKVLQDWMSLTGLKARWATARGIFLTEGI